MLNAQESVKDKDLCVDGSKIEGTGFTYSVPHLKQEALREVLRLITRHNNILQL
jgi:hypothetical protein